MLQLHDPSLLLGHSLIGGDLKPGGRAHAVINPATEQAIATVSLADAPMWPRALEAAMAAQPAWAACSGLTRGSLLRRWGDLMLAHEDDLALILTSEQGKPLAEAKAEIAYAAIDSNFNAIIPHSPPYTRIEYLWARFDPESPYFDYDETERLDKIIGDYPCDINDFTMIVAINKCEELYNSPIRKILMGAKKAVENLSLYLGTSEIESGRDGNLAQIVTTIKSLPQILKAYQEAENAYKMEVQKSRGNTKRAIDEDYNSDYDD
jgi:hypothetical protein